jgi:glutamyl-Q tRNA(Asp) synthetase
LVLGDNAEKLSKQNGALAVDTSEPVLALRALQSAAATLSLPTANAPPTMEQALAHWTSAWRARYVLHR